jgi:sialate O-acetylesterase
VLLVGISLGVNLKVIELGPLFQDGMVLQQGRPCPIWGHADPNQPVTVTFTGRTVRGTVDAQGNFKLRLPSFPSSATPQTLTVKIGDQEKTIQNVVVGEVWLCSGQSNMEMGVDAIQSAKGDINSANDPLLRTFLVNHQISAIPRPSVGGVWRETTPANLRQGGWAGFSAVGYSFGRRLRKELGVPVGLIGSYWGGTPAESWVSDEGLRGLKDWNSILDEQKAGREVDATSMSGYRLRLQGYLNGLDANGESLRKTLDPNSTGWQDSSLLGLWSRKGIRDVRAMWYRKTFNLDAAQARGVLTLSLPRAREVEVLYINGEPQRGVRLGDGSKKYFVSASKLRIGDNTLSVLVVNLYGDGGFEGNAAQASVEPRGGPAIPIDEGWQIAVHKTGQQGGYPVYPEHTAGALYNGMIAPLAPYAISGALWYQGESNARRAAQYEKLLPALVLDWRKQFETAFPFYIVQLAAFQQPLKTPAEDEWAELRESQYLTARRTPKCDIITAIDLGNANDIHPQQKFELGERLANLGLTQVYQRKGLPIGGPEYKSFKVEGSAIRITLTRAAGLRTSDGKAPHAFQIAGEDKKWVWANATIDKESVVVSAPGVTKPIAVRYAWSANPEVNLVNKDGWPALPFRTDNWPRMTANNK